MCKLAGYAQPDATSIGVWSLWHSAMFFTSRRFAQIGNVKISHLSGMNNNFLGGTEQLKSQAKV